MIPIQLWRARIGLFNAKRHSGPRSSFSSSSLALLHEKSSIPPTAHSPICDSPPGSSTDKHVPSTGHDHEHKRAFSTETDSSSSTVVSITREQSAVYTNSTFSAQLGSKTVHSLLSSMTDQLYLPSDLLKDALVMLLIVIISQLLVLSGDVETNPGPIASDKPTTIQLISLKKTDGSGEYLRVIEWITSLSRSKCMDFAHLLLVDPVKVETHQKKSSTDEFVRAVLEDWLSSGDDSKAVPRTWEALADCMEAAGLPGTLVKAIRETCPSGSPQVQIENEDVNMPPANKLMVSSHSDTIEGSTMEHAPVQVLVKPDIPKELLALMEEYSDMLVVLQTVRLSKERLSRLKLFLAGYCDEKSFKKCPSPEEIVEQLKLKLKIHIFNIDTLTACCKHFRNSKVSQCIQQYKENLNTFLSTTSVKELRSSLLTDEITCLDDTEPLTLKLNETASDDTLMNLKKLVYHFFGHSSKALIIPSLVSTLKAKAQQLSSEYLASRGVLELVIGLRIAPNEDQIRIDQQMRDQKEILEAKRKAKLRLEEKNRSLDIEQRLWHTRSEVELLQEQATTSVPTLRTMIDLFMEEYSDWKSIGIGLNIPYSKLQRIQALWNEPWQCMVKMIGFWLSTTPNASWYEVVDALCRSGHHRLAYTIHKQHQHLWRSRSPQLTEPATDRAMMHHLIKVHKDWFEIGTNLNIPPHKLREIEFLYDQKRESRQSMLKMIQYLELTMTSWKDIVFALEQTGHFTLASTIEQQYLSSSTFSSSPESPASLYFSTSHKHTSTARLDTPTIARSQPRKERKKVADCNELSLQSLLNYFHVMSNDWLKIGRALGVPDSMLHEVEAPYQHGGLYWPTVDRPKQQMTEMFQYWLDNTPDASWEQVVRALEHIGQSTLALTIKQQQLWVQPSYGAQQSKRSTTTNWWKEIHQVTPAPPESPVRLEEVQRALDWKFINKQPPINQYRRYYVFLKKAAVYLPGSMGLRTFCPENHFMNMARLTKIIDDIVEDVVPPSGYEYQCSAQLGKIAWYIDEELLHEHQQQPLTLERFTKFFESQKMPQGETKNIIQEEFFPRVTTVADKMLTKLRIDYQMPEPELECYLQMQLFNKEDESIMYSVKVTEKHVTHGSTFQLSDFWSPRTLRERKADFLCFGRAHDIRITCRCANDEMPEDVKSDIETIVNSCTRNKEGNLEMILKTNKVVVGHIFDRIVHKFSTHDDWFVNYITHTDHFIDKESQSEGVVTPLPSGHCCKDIEVMLQQTGTESPDKIKEKVFKMVDFSLDLVDMAENCLDPERQ